jgi:hypothetical protein
LARAPAAKPSTSPREAELGQLADEFAHGEAGALHPLQHEVGEDGADGVDEQTLGEEHGLDLAWRDHVSQQRNDDRRSGDRDDGAEEDRRGPRQVETVVGRRPGADGGHRGPDGEQVADRAADLQQPLGIQRQAALKENDGDPEMDQHLEDVAQARRVEQLEGGRAAQDPEDQQRQDRRHLEPFGDHLGGDPESDSSNQRGENHRQIIQTNSNRIDCTVERFTQSASDSRPLVLRVGLVRDRPRDQWPTPLRATFGAAAAAVTAAAADPVPADGDNETHQVFGPRHSPEAGERKLS